MDRRSGGFYHGGVVSETRFEGEAVGGAEDVGAEDLRGLDDAQLLAVDRAAAAISVDLAHGFDHGNDGDGCTISLRCCEARGNDGRGDERSHPVVHRDEAAGGGEGAEAVQDRMETRRTARDDAVRAAEGVCFAELLPGGALVSGEHKEQVGGIVPTIEGFDGVHQDGASGEGQELLRLFATHACSAAARHDEDGLWHGLTHRVRPGFSSLPRRP